MRDVIWHLFHFVAHVAPVHHVIYVLPPRTIGA
jgi:hypothetical protein